MLDYTECISTLSFSFFKLNTLTIAKSERKIIENNDFSGTFLILYPNHYYYLPASEYIFLCPICAKKLEIEAFSPYGERKTKILLNTISELTKWSAILSLSSVNRVFFGLREIALHMGIDKGNRKIVTLKTGTEKLAQIFNLTPPTFRSVIKYLSEEGYLTYFHRRKYWEFHILFPF